MVRKFWLMKSEPDVFSFQDLQKAKKQTTCWDGVRNYQARNFMRDEMKKGDLVLYYHSNTKPPHIAGVAEVVKESYPDHTQFDATSKYFDPKSTLEKPRWFMVDIKAVAEMKETLSLDTLKNEASLAEMKVVQRGQRLSVQPVTAAEFKRVLKIGRTTL